MERLLIPPRVLATPAAEEWIHKLEDIHGPLLFPQSGGCCDGSAPKWLCHSRWLRTTT